MRVHRYNLSMLTHSLERVQIHFRRRSCLRNNVDMGSASDVGFRELL